MVLNRFPWWKNVLVIVVVFLAFLYALPNLYVEDPAVQISPASATSNLDQVILDKMTQALTNAHLPYKQVQLEDRSVLIRFASTDIQLKAKELIQQTLGENYLVALNLAPATPHWLRAIGAMPMKLGLDLRGGVHFLLQVDVDSVTKQRMEGDLNSIGQKLRNEHIRYSGIVRNGANGITVQFRTPDARDEASRFLTIHFSEFVWTKDNKTNDLQGILSPLALQQARQDTLDQAMNTLRNRVNELGVSEAVVQQQGATRVMVELPGIQDTAQAKNILGKTATP